MLVPTLCVGTPHFALRGNASLDALRRAWDAERPGLHSHAEPGNDPRELCIFRSLQWPRNPRQPPSSKTRSGTKTR
ncbi:hypothetical protein C1X27_22070 [Pseudomonas sp. MPR-AND1B]|nr:hypothetical protein C1X26_20415 [Pseudomonas sp. MPR-R3A]PMY96233.1 hypothetical protein C1X24_21195 [Pseudomonas sp. FW305-124]PMZ68150.1 hypothetical protein C1X25_24615 [Pseudomonas sp. GW247-3R2A]PNA89990.1 hypothetical protein C1X23_22730 [Pseudomonas sp. FW300-E2]PNA98655.1 hypothetical protein C1X27_22070 [Pseudomonas sp. MPR-AND1B]PRW66266.1 hypothetical protein C7A09_24375 [Pseudomonas fluorescens]PTT07321.1 hypothetical protein DBR14_27065 [Pseudomonas sp. HMWF034]PVV64162.1 hy